MKIGVYAIALNEEAFAERWATSAKDADYILVADTGSTDRTVEILESLGVVVVKTVVKPWRFDMARNVALMSMPADMDAVIALDLDEVLRPGWREKLEAAWTPETTRLTYQYIWTWKPDGTPDHTYYGDKIIGRHTHIWRGPVHEVAVPTVPEVITTTPEFLIEQHADFSKPRSQYFPLLELCVKEDPTNDRNSHYLGREYYYHNRLDEAIAELTRHLSLPKATWAPERAASMRYMAKCYEKKGDMREAGCWFVKATLEHESRGPWCDLGKWYLQIGDWYGALHCAMKSLALPSATGTYMAEYYASNEGPDDIASVAYFNLGEIEKAKYHAVRAVELNPHDERLKANVVALG